MRKWSAATPYINKEGAASLGGQSYDGEGAGAMLIVARIQSCPDADFHAPQAALKSLKLPVTDSFDSGYN
jgi:hypothetical protein